jgi:hypothetical protein
MAIIKIYLGSGDEISIERNGQNKSVFSYGGLPLCLDTEIDSHRKTKRTLERLKEIIDERGDFDE